MEIFLGITIGICFGLFIIAVFSAGFAFFAYSKVVGFENSTHQVQYIDPTEGLDQEDEEDDDFPFKIPHTLEAEEEEDLIRGKKRDKFSKELNAAFGFTEEEIDSII